MGAYWRRALTISGHVPENNLMKRRNSWYDRYHGACLHQSERRFASGPGWLPSGRKGFACHRTTVIWPNGETIWQGRLSVQAAKHGRMSSHMMSICLMAVFLQPAIPQSILMALSLKGRAGSRTHSTIWFSRSCQMIGPYWFCNRPDQLCAAI